MAMMIRCCICGRTLKGVRPFLLHIVHHNIMKIVRDECDPHNTDIDLACACGVQWPFPPNDWHPHKGLYTMADHLYNSGGLEHHLWAILMGETEMVPPRTSRPEPLS